MVPRFCAAASSTVGSDRTAHGKRLRTTGRIITIAGRLGQRTPHGVANAEAGHTMNGHAPGTVMQVFNSGTTNLDALIMFVVDATKPFSVPAKMP